MKKVMAVLFAVILVAFSCVPAFAVVSPIGTYEYKVTIIPTTGGDASYKFTSEIDSEGKQKVNLTSTTEEGYTFDHWVIDGPYTTEGELTDPTLDVVITGDITVTPYFKSVTSPTTSTTVTTDKASTSPQTGSSDAAAYAVIILAAAVCAVSVTKLVKAGKSK